MINDNEEPIFSKDVQHLIDIFKPPPPKWVYKPVPNFSLLDHPKREEDKYWDEENRRWIEGHINESGEFIPPNQYFYIQNCMLKDVNGNYLRPLWRDADEMMATWSLECLKSRKSLLIYKRREVGATAFFSNQGFWIWRTMPGTHCAFTSGKGQTGITAMFNSKILFSFNNFNKNVINATPVQISNSQTKTALTIPMIQRIDGEDVTKYCSLIARETSENPESVTNISGERAKYVYLDEGPLHTRLEKFLGSIFPVINEGVIRTGLLVIAGTVEPSLTDVQISNFKNLIERSANLKLRTEILPVWVGMKYLDKNGWSNKEAGLLWYEEQVRMYQDSLDFVGLRDFKMQYPKDERDIFDMAAGTMFEPDNIEILKKRRTDILAKNEEFPYKLVPTQSGFEMIPDTKRREPEKDGGFWMVEPPKEGLNYFQAIDSIGSAKKDGADKGSWIASVIFKGYDPVKPERSYEPVCVYFERPQTIEAGYRNITNQLRYYNKFDGVKETNYETNIGTGDHFGTFLEKEGLYTKYANKRRDLSGKGYINTKKRGTPVNTHTRQWQIKHANMFLRKYATQFRSLMVINQLLIEESVNADIRDAFLVFMTSIPDFDKPPKPPAEKNYRTDIILAPDSNGRMTYQQRKIEILPPQLQEDQDAFLDFEMELKRKYGFDKPYQKANGEEREKYNRLKALCGHADQVDS
jgi:hypothetical protein